MLNGLVLNTLGCASTRAVMIITWMLLVLVLLIHLLFFSSYFAFTVLYALSEIAYAHRFIGLAYSVIFYALTLAIGGPRMVKSLPVRTHNFLLLCVK